MEKGLSAQLNSLRIAPRKVRIVVDTIRGKPVGEALNILTFTRKAAALPVKKLLESAVANARQAGRDVDTLTVGSITVDQGTKLRRFMPRAMGRAFRVEKKTSHIKVVLGAVK
jgi:large subunit ribosomal protein L22